ncbi:MAG TPA: FkbM family methyltransferase [Candidatus Avacidaminococcus intestinavium]|uniref:FkbM family methyltransferase n=1 Tax=Candidatus Avacidaminococcus intestinavium TaxID=2840684 RepID=A0A9D1MQ04_9FIRM|nr:FkbM family methyltransferase [Candidatus Avacidaminococcus intestinavium]
MLTFIRPRKTVWETLKATSKPIVLYGMGNGADKILDWCAENSVQVQAIFASDAFVRGQSFRGFQVVKYSEILEKFVDPLIVLAFASEGQDVLNFFQQLMHKHEVVAPHLPLFAGDEVVSREWLMKYETQLATVYQRLADETSKEVFAGILKYKLSGRPEYLFEIESQRKEDCQTLLTFGVNDVYVDAGAYDGDTIKEFLSYTQGKFKKIFALEPDQKNYKKLTRYINGLELSEIQLYNAGVWHQSALLQFEASGGRQSTLATAGKTLINVAAIDDLVRTDVINYMKFDVEGAELNALRGAKRTIEKCKPQLLLAAYHRDNDLWELPLYLWSLRTDYQIFLRKHPYIPAWEINYIAI